MRLLLAVLVLAGCGGDDVGSQRTTLTAAGLYTDPNDLALPEGALSRADNVVIQRPGVVEAMRGFAPFASSIGGTPSRFVFYSDALLAHYGSGTLARFASDGTKTAYAGTFAPPSGFRTRFAEAGGTLYFTTDAGVQRLDSLTGTPAPAGVPQALDPTISVTGSSGYLADASTVAYRLVWVYRDASGVPHYGAPSGRVVLANTAGGTRNASVVAQMPSGITTSHYLRIYRTRTASGSTTDPGDEMGIAYEKLLTNLDVAAGSVTITDNTPDVVLGEALYTNATQEGILAGNLPPPLCRDIVRYSDMLACAHTAQGAAITLTLLSAAQLETLRAAGAAPTIGLFSASGFYWEFIGGTAENLPSLTFQIHTSGTATQNIENTARSMVRAVNYIASSSGYSATYISGAGDMPGRFAVFAASPSTSEFYLSFLGSEGAMFSPQLSSYSIGLIGNVVRAANVVTVSLARAHTFVVGQQVEALSPGSADANFPVGTKTIASVPSATSFTFAEAGASTSNASTISYLAHPSTLGAVSSGDAAPNRISFSKPSEFEAFPILRYVDVGASNRPILAIAPVGSSLMVFKEGEGLFRVTGNDESSFAVDLVDSGCELIGQDTVVSLDGSLFALTRKGVVRISEGGVSDPISGPIQTDLLALFSSALTQVKAQAFAVAYESEGLYRLWLPSASSDTAPTQAYVYSVRTNTWTRDTRDATAGAVDPLADKLYLGTAGSAVVVERKARTASDHQDENGAAIPVSVRFAPFTAGSPGALKRFRQAQLLVQDNSATTVGMTFSTDHVTTEQVQPVTLGSLANGTIPALVPPEATRGTRLIVGVDHSTAAEKLSIGGIVLDYADTGGSNTRK